MTEYRSQPWHNAGGARFYIQPGSVRRPGTALRGGRSDRDFLEFDSYGKVPMIERTFPVVYADEHADMIERECSGTTHQSVPDHVEAFGNNRSHKYWNEKDYPIETTNGADLTSWFPQDADTEGLEVAILKKLWGDFSL